MSICLAVMQPTFLPWAGYFNLMSQADDFVFLDDVQLEKQSWQTRNRWINDGRVCWIIAPVKHTCLDQTLVETVFMDQTPWRAKLAKGFALNYGRHPFFAEAKEIFDILLESQEHSLARLNERLIRYIAEKLGLTTRLHRSSELGVRGIRSERLVALTHFFLAEEYLSPIGSAAYLAEDGFATKSNARLRFQNYVPKTYEQKGCETFNSHLSVVDVIANIGWKKTRSYVETGYE